MIAGATRQTIERILACDPDVLEAERDWVLAALDGPQKQIPAKEAAELLGVSRSSFFAKLQRREWRLTPHKRNRKVVLYEQREVLALLQKFSEGQNNGNQKNKT